MLLECSWFPMLWQRVFWTPGVVLVDPLGVCGAESQLGPIDLPSWFAVLIHLKERELPAPQLQPLGSPALSHPGCRSASHHPPECRELGAAWPGAIPPQWGRWVGIHVHPRPGLSWQVSANGVAYDNRIYSHHSGGRKSDISVSLTSVSPGWFLPLVLMENALPASLPASCRALGPSRLVDAISSVPATELASPSSPGPRVSPLLSLLRILSLDFRTTQIQDDLNLMLTASAKTLIPNNVIFWGSGWTWILGGHYSPVYHMHNNSVCLGLKCPLRGIQITLRILALTRHTPFCKFEI